MGIAFGRTLLCSLAATLLLGLAACGKKGSYEPYVPSGGSARQALEAALEAWKNGQKPGKIDAVGSYIQAVDSQWKAGQKLAAYEILEEETGNGPRFFSVRLKMQKPAGEKVVRYVVVGKEPLWVYREEDYKKRSTEM